MHRRLSDEQLAALGPGAVWEGLEISGGRNREDRLLFFDNLCFYREPLPPLTFEPRPSRGVELFSGQCPGTNTGPGQLPFPESPGNHSAGQLDAGLHRLVDARRRRIPVCLRRRRRAAGVSLRRRDRNVQRRVGRLDLGGRTVRFRPMEGGGVRFGAADGLARRQPPTGSSCWIASGWRIPWSAAGNATGRAETAEVRYTFRLWQKSLVVDVACPAAGSSSGFRIGDRGGPAAAGHRALSDRCGTTSGRARVGTARSAAVLDGLGRSYAKQRFGAVVRERGRSRPGDVQRRCALSAENRWTAERLLRAAVSDRFAAFRGGSAERAQPEIALDARGGRAGVAGACRQQPRAGLCTLAASRASWNDQDRVDRPRDGLAGRRREFHLPHAGRAGQRRRPGQAEYARKIRALGFRYGIYNNYTDFAPVNEFWHEDWSPDCRTANGGPPGRGATIRNRRGPSNTRPAWLRSSSRSSNWTPPTATCIPRCSRGATAISTPGCPAPARSPPRSTPTARSCCTRRRPGTGRSTAKATITGTTAD
jgi:hypothetical protein